MRLQQFICFYYYFAALRSHWAVDCNGPVEVSWLSGQNQDTVHEQMVQLQFESPVFLHEDVELECNFQLNNKQLYSIKWYKDEQEFFQYAPHEKPRVRTFASKGVRFETPSFSIINDTFRLWLHNVNLDTQGIYRCEISTDAPDFTTLKDHKTLEVYVLPSKSPRITGSRANFQPKGRVDLNCTSPKSKPVSTLQWFINDKLAPSDYLIPYKLVNHSDGLQTKTLRLKFVVNEEHFKHGDMLKCVATYQRLSLENNQTWIRRHSKWNHQTPADPTAKPSAQPGTDSNASQRHLAGSVPVMAVTGTMMLLYLARLGAVPGDV